MQRVNLICVNTCELYYKLRKMCCACVRVFVPDIHEISYKHHDTAACLSSTPVLHNDANLIPMNSHFTMWSLIVRPKRLA